MLAKALETLGFTTRSMLAKALPIVYKQTTPGKLHLLKLENIPQACMALFYSLLEGGSAFVLVLNLILPVAQILFAKIAHKFIKKRIAPWFGGKLEAAIHDGNEPEVAQLVRQADFGSDLDFLRDTCQHWESLNSCLLDSSEADVQALSDDAMVNLWAASEALCASSSLNLSGPGTNLGRIYPEGPITDVGLLSKALLQAELLQVLSLADNKIANVDELCGVLEKARSLARLKLHANQISEVGALSKLVEGSVTLSYLSLHDNRISNVDTLASAVQKNTSLARLTLEGNPIEDGDARAALAADARKRVSLSSPVRTVGMSHIIAV
eukprot:TRINITY_DN16275_c0_g1_i1.p1 TRINITY_DN16275_c0_g1~~TRINITY_DN16275_c0_g1_i1.p1  ORF type:complete len:325 (-),score=45.85 TRINITY_DN16275_c0_g1_i1:37-1011(-)